MTCDHAANVDCQAQPQTEDEEDDEENEVSPRPALPCPNPPCSVVDLVANKPKKPKPAGTTKAPLTSTVPDSPRSSSYPLPPIPTVGTAPPRPRRPPTQAPTYRPWSPPVTPKDDSPLPDVDNSLDHAHPRYTPSDTLRQNTRRVEVVQEGMNAEKVVIILLVIILLVVFCVLAWCFRVKIREFSEPYIDNWQQKARKPSSVGLLHAYKLNKIPWPQKQESSPAAPAAPAPPPQDYRTAAGLLQSPQAAPPPTPPRDYSSPLAIPNSVSRTTITLPYSGAPGLQPYTRPSPRGQDPTYSEIPAHTQQKKPEAPPRRRRPSVTENTSEV